MLLACLHDGRQLILDALLAHMEVFAILLVCMVVFADINQHMSNMNCLHTLRYLLHIACLHDCVSRH